jgi:GNAT superfamily N-acetyltransferase
MIDIRPASSSEADLIADLAQEIWSEHYAAIISPEQITYMLRVFQSAEKIRTQMAEGYEYALALDDGAPVGYCAARLDETVLFLSKLYLRRSHRGQNLSRLFLTRLIQTARENRKSTLQLFVHKRNPSLAVYQHIGFVITEPVITDIGGGFVLDDYKMELRLP